jgi:hypothetical protein
MSSGPFSCEEDQTESETELYSDDIESEHDDTDSEDEMEYQGGVISVLQSRLCIVLGHDLELAAHLIRQAHTQWRIGAVTEATVYTVAPSNEPIGAGESHGPVSAPSSIPGNSIFHDGSNQPKRERKRDESEDRRGNGSPKRRRIMSDGSHIRLPFACHFHKMDPIRYCRSKGEKFRGCLGLPPSVRDLRRIK